MKISILLLASTLLQSPLFAATFTLSDPHGTLIQETINGSDALQTAEALTYKFLQLYQTAGKIQFEGSEKYIQRVNEHRAFNLQFSKTRIRHYGWCNTKNQKTNSVVAFYGYLDEVSGEYQRTCKPVTNGIYKPIVKSIVGCIQMKTPEADSVQHAILFYRSLGVLQAHDTKKSFIHPDAPSDAVKDIQIMNELKIPGAVFAAKSSDDRHGFVIREDADLSLSVKSTSGADMQCTSDRLLLDRWIGLFQ